jgi:hypothetical protein
MKMGNVVFTGSERRKISNPWQQLRYGCAHPTE